MHPVSLISLDGAQYGVGGAGMVQEDDRAQGYTEGALRLSGVPRALQLAAPLDMRVASVQVGGVTINLLGSLRHRRHGKLEGW